MKAFNEDWMKQHECHTTQTQRLSARLERTWIPQWSSSTKTRTEIRNESKGTQLGRARAATFEVDTRLKGYRKLLHANMDVSGPLSRVACECRLRGSRICTMNCPCLTKWKSCGVECECHGFCCNSFFHTPRLSIRNGALGEELYTKSDLPRCRIAFVMCGRIMTVPEYWRYHEKLLHRTMDQRIFCFVAGGLPGYPDLDMYAVDPIEDMTGAVNHSCEPNVVFEACWANGKLYAVGRTTRNIMAKEALTVDYKWKGTAKPREFAEICRCREALCRGLIAEKGSKFLESSTSYYEGKITRLQEHHAITEKALQQRYEDLAAAERVGSNTVEVEMDLIRKENENGKLKANIELMIAAVARSRASLFDASEVLTDVVEAPEVNKSHVSPLRKFMRRIYFPFSRNQKEYQEDLAEVTIETSETNPYFVSDSALSSYRIVPMPSARSENRCTFTPRRGPPSARATQVPRLALPPRPRYLIGS